MTKEEYIRKAIELAETKAPWDFYQANDNAIPYSTVELDALAAQLVRQIESPKYIAKFYLDMARGHVAVRRIVDIDEAIDVSACYAEGRTMNTIKAIVDSGVMGG